MTAIGNVPENAVCGPTGKPIAYPMDMRDDMFRVVDLVRERFGRNYGLERGMSGNLVYMVPVEPMAEKALTIPERAAIEALAWYCREYTGGLKRNVSVTFPKIIHDHGDAKAIDDEDPLSFGDEARAYMFAEVAEYIFPVAAQVIETPAGWAVTVSDERRGLNAELLAHLQGACRVLMHFVVESAAGAYASQSSNHMHDTPSPEARHAWHDRKNAQANRIEDGIAAILAHLGHPEALGRESAASAHRDPQRAAKGGKTASSKSAPVAVDVFDEDGGNGDKHRLPTPSRKPAKSPAKSK